MGNFEGFRGNDSGGSTQADVFSSNFWSDLQKESPTKVAKVGTDTGAKPHVHGAEDTPRPRETDAPAIPPEVAPGAPVLSKEHPSPLVSAAAFDALKKIGVDLTEPGAFLPDPNNPEQLYFADRLPKAVDLLPNLPKGVEVKGMASKETPDPVNDFLKKEGFDISLQKDPDDPNGLYLAGTLKVKDDWNASAHNMEANDGKTYPSVQKGGYVFDIDGMKGAEIHSNDDKGIKVYAIPMPEDLPGYKVNELAEQFVKKAHDQGTPEDRKRIEFPMVDLNSQQTIDGLIGMKVANSDLEIKQAQMQTIVKMDEDGFEAKQAAAFGIATKSAVKDPPVDFQVKDKFIFAVADSNGNLVFATQIGQENWKRPEKPVDFTKK